MGAYITDDKGNIVYPRTLAKCVKKGGTTLDDYLDKVEDNLLIKPTTQGTDIQLQDASDMDIQELHLYGKTEQKTTKGKNLFDANEVLSTFIEDGRVTVTGEGVLINGTFGATNRNFNIILKKGTYYISGGGILHILAPGDSTFDKKIVVEDEEKTFQCYIASGTYTNKLIQPQIEIGSVATDYEPYTGGIASPNPEYPQDIDSVENPTVSVAKKNLYSFNMNGVPKETTRNGIKYIKNQDGSLKIKGTATATSKYEVITLNKSPQIFKNSTIGEKFTFKIFGLPETCYWEMSYTGNVYGEKSRTFVNIEKYASKKYTVLAIPEGVTVDTTIYPMLVLGDSISEYEPYKEIQSAQQTCKLNGIDDVRDELIVRADGTGQLIQRWYKPENEFVRCNVPSDPKWYDSEKSYSYEFGLKSNGLIVKTNGHIGKCSHLTSYSFNQFYNKKIETGIMLNQSYLVVNISKELGICTTKNEFKKWWIDNNVEVITQLKEPIITNLTAEEVQEVLALHTNKPNTTIWNDQNAEMQVTYVADAKNYIDNKFTELENSVCGGLLITDNLIDNSNMLNNTALTISDKISTSSNSTYKTYLNIPVKAGESYYIGKSHRNSCIIDSIENKKVLQSNMVNQTDSYIFNVNYDGFLCVCFYTTEQNPKIALLTREKTES